MKRLRSIAFVLMTSLLFVFTACNDTGGSGSQSTYNTEDASGHTVNWSPDGKDSAANITYVNDNGSTSHFWMNYLLFRTLFDRGGYNGCYNYYTTHPTEFNNTSQYSSYTSRPGNMFTASSNTATSATKYVPPANTKSSPSSGGGNYTKTYTSPSRPSSISPSTYTSPSRPSISTPKTYSSPSRPSSFSSSSSSKSYTSPSRSYSSPGRH